MSQQRKLTKAQEKSIARKVLNGVPYSKIAPLFDITIPSVKHIANKYGVNSKRAEPAQLKNARIKRHKAMQKHKTSICNCRERFVRLIKKHEMEAEKKAEKSLKNGRFIMYGFWKATGVHMREIMGEVRRVSG